MASTDDIGSVTGPSFAVRTAYGTRSFTLPVKPRLLKAVLERQGVPQRYRIEELAERVAWRILKDWVEGQLAIIRMEMVSSPRLAAVRC